MCGVKPCVVNDKKIIKEERNIKEQNE